MATKSYSKHKEYKEYSSSGNIPYTDEQFDMIKSDLIPRGSKLENFNNGAGSREYHYEYKEEKHPSGKYDRKDLHTVEEYTIPPKTTPKSSESSTYYYQREERDLPAITSGTRTYNYETSTSSTPGYSKVKSSKVTKELAHNVDELDSLLDDLQKDQERQLYKSGYTSDTAESTSFDYKRGTPAKAPSSGYSTLKREEVVESSSWGTSPLAPPPAPVTRSSEVRQEMFREETTESRVVPAPAPVSPQNCTHCHHVAGTLTRSTTPMNKVTTTVKTYTYEVPAGQEPSTLPLPAVADTQHTYVEELRSSNTSTLKPSPPSPAGCQYCAHCNARVRDVETVTNVTNVQNVHNVHKVTDLERVSDRSERMVYPAPANDVKSPEQLNGHPPHGPSTYKYTETSYSSHNSTQRFPSNTHLSPSPSPRPAHIHLTPSPAPAPFPRPTTPSPGQQQTPKKLDDLLADFPEARFPTQPDGAYRRKVEVSETTTSNAGRASNTASKNVAGPAVYYPPGHTPFANKPETQLAGYQQSSAMQGGGAYASGRGMYEYESGSKSKEKHSERKTAVPVCLPLCCAMPCVIM